MGGVSIELGHSLWVSCLFSHGKTHAAVFFINHCMYDSVGSEVRSKELCRRVFSAHGEIIQFLADFMDWVYTFWLVTPWKERKQKETFLPFKDLGERTSKPKKNTQISQLWKHNKIYLPSKIRHRVVSLKGSFMHEVILEQSFEGKVSCTQYSIVGRMFL